MPVKEVVTDELPTNSGSSTNTAVPMAIVTVTERKIPISLKHMGKSKDFTFLETKTIGDLHTEIRRLSTCTSMITIEGIPKDVALTNPLKVFNIKLPDLTPLKVVLNCTDKQCHQQFNSEMLVKTLSTQEQLSGAKAKIAELLAKNEKLVNELAKTKVEKIKASSMARFYKQQ